MLPGGTILLKRDDLQRLYRSAPDIASSQSATPDEDWEDTSIAANAAA